MDCTCALADALREVNETAVDIKGTCIWNKEFHWEHQLGSYLRRNETTYREYGVFKGPNAVQRSQAHAQVKRQQISTIPLGIKMNPASALFTGLNPSFMSVAGLMRGGWGWN